MPEASQGSHDVASDRIRSLIEGNDGDVAAGEVLEDLRELMWREVGPLRTAAGLARAIERLEEMRTVLQNVTVPPGRRFNAALAEWFELRGSLVAASAVAYAAAARTESRGAHQREDFPDTDPGWTRSQRVAMKADGALTIGAQR
jgi:succinate dehydrogenase/fumarate reductase flavoprotein subunit